MTVTTAASAVTFELPPARFVSYASPRTGSGELCVWRVELGPRSAGQDHTITRDEALVMIDGHLTISIDDETHRIGVGDVAILPAGSIVSVANAEQVPASAWVSTTVGFTAMIGGDAPFTPPWAS